MRTVVIVSPYFPPATLAGVHRARHLSKNLPFFGWRPVVVRIAEDYYTERLDPMLATLLPSDVNQVSTGAISAGITRYFGFSDLGLRGYLAIRKSIKDVVIRNPVDAILITGSPFYPMLLAGYLRNTFRIPVILDFQDPWLSAEGARQHLLSKGGAAHFLSLLLEPRALMHAEFITSVSERQNEEMAMRYAWLDRSRMAAIPIGGDPDDFEALRRKPPEDPQVRLDPNRIHLSYIGTLLPRAGPLVRILFQALSDVREQHPTLAARLQLNFVGTSNQPNGTGLYAVSPIAEAAGVGDLVRETPQRVPFLESLSLLVNSQGLLIIGSDEPHYTASKIYPCLMSGTPFLSIFHSASSAHAILSCAGGGLTFSFETSKELAQLRSELSKGLFRLATAPATIGRADALAYEAYTARSVTGQFAKVFERVIS